MAVTVTDLFCGAGGSSRGAAMAGAEIVMAANHWSTAIEVCAVLSMRRRIGGWLHDGGCWRCDDR